MKIVMRFQCVSGERGYFQTGSWNKSLHEISNCNGVKE